MAEGRSNQAIAERLVITLRAVEKHVTSIFGKLRLRRRPRITGACWRSDYLRS
jgi:DNA-binding NarL/FixJ family response regulator